MNRIKLILSKEMLEFRRDKRVVTSALLMPILIVIMFVMLIGFLQKTLGEKKATKIHVVAMQSHKAYLDDLKKDGFFEFVNVESPAAGEKLLRDGKAKLLLTFENGFESKVKAKQQAKIEALYDDSETMSQIALARVQEALGKRTAIAANLTLSAMGMSMDKLTPVKIEQKKLIIEEALGNSGLLGMIPYLIVIYAFYGGFGIVSDLVAGEKEKQTLETLLVSPVKRTEVALGKFLSLGIVCFLSAMTTLIAVWIVGSVRLKVTETLFPEGVRISAPALLAIMAVLVPLVALFSASMIAISAYAKNVREAQTNLALMSFVVLMPAVFSQFIGFTDFAKAKWISAVPVLNSSMAIRDALKGTVDFSAVGITFAANTALAAVCLWLAVRMFRREEVLTRV